MTDKLEEIQILFQKRTARKRGPTSSDQMNDMVDELAHDLSEFNTQWNQRLVPLTSAIPNGDDDADIDAWANGLDGGNLYVDQNATASVNSTYYNSPSTRPNTVLEQFDSIYLQLNTIRDDLENQINNSVLTAIQVSVTDAQGLYQSANVEEALTEVMTQVNALSLVSSSLDLSAVAQNYIPSVDDLFDIGSFSKRVRDIYLGPASVRIIAKAADAEAPSDKNFRMAIESGTGDLLITESNSATTLLRLNTSSGVSFPEGVSGINQELDDLTDVDTTGETNGDVLTFNGTTWVPLAPSATDFTSISTNVEPDIHNTRDLGTLTGPRRWANLYLGGVIDALGATSKVRSEYANVAAFPSAATYRGMFAYAVAEDATYVAKASGWMQILDEEASIDVATDVDTSGKSTDDVLTWDGASWGAAAVPAPSAINDIGDVDAATPDVDDILRWDGANWVADTVPGGGGGGSGDIVDQGGGAQNLIAVWDSTSGIRGDENLTWDGVDFNVSGDFTVSGETNLTHTHPLLDNAYDLGISGIQRWRSLFLGPGSMHIEAKNGDPGFTSDHLFTIDINPSTGSLEFKEGETVVAAMNAVSGVDFPQGGAGGSLDELSDVTITTPSNSEVLTYSGGQWVNSPAAGAGGGAPEYTVPAIITANGVTTLTIDTYQRVQPHSSGGTICRLPAISAGNAGKTIIVKYALDQTYDLTIDTTGSDTIDGVDEVVLNTARSSLTFVSDGVSEWGMI